MKNKIVIIFLILVLAISLVSAFGQREQQIKEIEEEEIEEYTGDCPMENAYFYLNEFVGICINDGDENDPGWYWIENETNKKERTKEQDAMTTHWIQDGLKIKDRENEIIGINLIPGESNKNESIKILFASTESVFKWGENEITNIINSGEGSYYYIDFNTIKERIEIAALVMGHGGSNITFNGQKFFAPTGTAITFNEEEDENPKITLRGESSIQDLFRYLKSGESLPQISISGRDLEISPDLTLINGQISIQQNGFLLEEGIANYRQMQFKTEDENILFANENTDLSGYGGNWIFQNQNELRMQSSDTGTISAKILENQEILNSDSLDRAEFTITSGDGILIKSRNSEGLIPTLEHLSSDSGETTIQNDGLKIGINNNEITMLENSSLRLSNYDTPYQSLAMEISSDSRKSRTNMRINSYRQFAIVDEREKELVTMNTFNLPVSTRVEDNSLQTIEQMREKYPGIKFEIENNARFNEENMPPYLLYTTDYFFEEMNPSAAEDYGKVKFSSFGSYNTHVYGTEPILTIGERSMDTYSRTLREIKGPMQIFVHEYNHQIDKNIISDEIDYIICLDLDSQLIKESVEELKELKERISSRGPVTIDEISEEDVRRLSQLQNRIPWLYENFYGEISIRSVYQEQLRAMSAPLFSEENREETATRLNKITENFDSNYLERIQGEIDSIIIEKYGITAMEYLIERGTTREELEELSQAERIGAISKELSDISKREEENYLSVNELERIQSIGKFSSSLNKITQIVNDENPPSSPESAAREISLLYSYIPLEENREEIRNQLQQLIQDRSGLMFTYSGHNERELSSTWAELTRDQKKLYIRNSRGERRKMYETLTQIEFDTGKITAQDYGYIMSGWFNCWRRDCSDKACIQYKSMCCINLYPNSPNCDRRNWPENPNC